MKLTAFSNLLFYSSALGAVIKRGQPQFKNGQPIDANGKGAPILGCGTNHQVDLSNPSNLAQQGTDGGTVPNLKWRFSDSKTKIFNGGWVREQVVQDLPQSHDISAAQQHLRKGAIRELHWHRVAEWGFVYTGRVLVSAVNEKGEYELDVLEYGDIWYFPKGQAHTVQGLEEENEFLLVFDDGDFDKVGTTFNLDDWLTHTPKSIVAKSLGIDEKLLNSVPEKNPYIQNSTVSIRNVTSTDKLVGNSSFVYHTLQHPSEPVPGGGGMFYKIDSTNFPVSTTIAATFVVLEPGGLRELHWHPTAEEWLYFHEGEARATVFIGNGNSRTFDFSAGDTAVFPDNSGHYIENTSTTKNLTWIEIYKADRVADIPLTQWLALTPADIVASILKIPIEVAESLSKEKKVLLRGT
ncbi:thermophilic glucose-6-phosphate isomerase [Delitschia confertaspora ATCC 74209]|uniref:Thermophilic glucose-6-phosphate isomerase n=1 Tax=Delitschia confertaspora ATCC 74209 TaxID=1513339 RepID=A0A9P4JSH2_9PLEO|nr:thermophilic glucose-6-phosphate isomerase [Delitschia confertaspora ATCC 74209]